MQWNKRNAIIYIQLKIKCKINLLKTLEMGNGFTKLYLMFSSKKKKVIFNDFQVVRYMNLP